MRYIALGNPIWSGQLQLLGGPRQVGSISFVFAPSLLLLFILLRWVQSAQTLSSVIGDTLRILAWIQLLLLLIGGTGAIRKALMRDHQTRMIESLRTSPLSAGAVITGYLFGPTIQIVGIWVVAVLFGAGLTGLAGGGTLDWIVGNFILVPACILAWSAQVFFGLGARRPVNLVIGVCVACLFLQTTAPALQFLPGVALFTGAHLALGAVTVMRTGTPANSVIGLSLFCASIMSVYWSLAAARRFRRPHLPAFGIGGALTLMGLWTFCAAAGVEADAYLYPSRPMGLSDAGEVVPLFLVQSLLALMSVVISVSVSLRRRLIMGAEEIRGSGRWPTVVTALIAAAVAATGYSLLAFLIGAGRPAAWSGVAAFIAAALLACGVFRLSRFKWNQIGYAWMSIAIVWVLPPVAAMMLPAVIGRNQGFVGKDLLEAVSPLAITAAGWSDDSALELWPILAQSALAAAALFVGHGAERRFVFLRRRMLEVEPHGAAPAQFVPSNSGVER